MPELDGFKWLEASHPQTAEIVRVSKLQGKKNRSTFSKPKETHTQISILFPAIPATPLVAGWWVHEWLWRGSSQVVQNRVPDITAIYESP